VGGWDERLWRGWGHLSIRKKRVEGKVRLLGKRRWRDKVSEAEQMSEGQKMDDYDDLRKDRTVAELATNTAKTLARDSTVNTFPTTSTATARHGAVKPTRQANAKGHMKPILVPRYAIRRYVLVLLLVIKRILLQVEEQPTEAGNPCKMIGGKWLLRCSLHFCQYFPLMKPRTLRNFRRLFAHVFWAGFATLISIILLAQYSFVLATSVVMHIQRGRGQSRSKTQQTLVLDSRLAIGIRIPRAAASSPMREISLPPSLAM
jgi:hypothetical protein